MRKLTPGKPAPEPEDMADPTIPGSRKQRLLALGAMVLIALGDELLRQAIGGRGVQPF